MNNLFLEKQNSGIEKTLNGYSNFLKYITARFILFRFPVSIVNQFSSIQENIKSTKPTQT